MAGRRITIQFLGEDKSLGKTAEGIERKTSGIGSKLATVGKVAGAGLAVAGLAAIKFGGDSLKAASDAQQSMGATETVFGKFSDSVVRNSDRAANSVGLSANAYRENANLIGSLFKNQGVASDELAGKTDNMIKLGADLAATFGGTTKDSVEALGSAFKGEYDPLERYGISLKESTVTAELAKRGQDKLTGAALNQAKQMAITDLITKQSKDSLGAFGRESDTLAGAQQRLSAKFENLKATLGEKLIPVATKVVSFFSKFIDQMESGKGAGGRFQAVMSGIGDVLRPIGEFIGNQMVPFIRDLFKRFQDAAGGTNGMKKSLNDLAPAVRVVKSVLGVLWEGFKLAARVLIPAMVRNFQLTAKVIGTLGRAAGWLWNKAFQPALQFIVRGIGGLLRAWGTMLSALGKVPGFEWAKRAGDAMQRAGDKAYRMAAGIRDIPNKKTVTVTYNEKVNASRRAAAIRAGAGLGVAGARATGGHVQAGGIYRVNERGTETFQPYSSGRIVNARQTAKAAGGDFNASVALDLRLDGKTVQRVLLKLKRQNGGVELGIA